MICHKSDNNSINLCTEYLKNGKILILPTDTVYGFSGIVSENTDTDSKIRLIKGREESKPMIQLISSPEELKKYTDDEIPVSLLSYWPGPLTIIVKDKRFSTAEKEITTAFRCPGDGWLREIIKNCEAPVYSTSVNRSGYPVLTTEKEIIDEFSSEVDLIVLNGDTGDSLPSTIVKVEKGEVKVLRQGAITL
ncbi:MAG: threonylcarbamoyl-AMP synthase [Treponema sp.]|nr:threonylcarbamoyl-AMP synthase [Treponema sp.]